MFNAWEITALSKVWIIAHRGQIGRTEVRGVSQKLQTANIMC
jgi:hypothetical protein